MKKLFILAVVVCLAAACKSSTTTTTPAPTISSIEVTSAHATILIGGTEQMTATVHMSDGTTRLASGTWSSNSPAQATVDQSGLVRGISAGAAAIVFSNTAGGQGSKTLTVRTVWSMSGSGDNVFDMPTYVSRVKITGTYNHYSSNFIVYIAGDLIVNELLGTGWDETYFEGIYVTHGGTVEIKYSNGVTWTFTEVASTSVTTNTSHKISDYVLDSNVAGKREVEIYRHVSRKNVRVTRREP